MRRWLVELRFRQVVYAKAFGLFRVRGWHNVPLEAGNENEANNVHFKLGKLRNEGHYFFRDKHLNRQRALTRIPAHG